jgi:hypothetical protein
LKVAQQKVAMSVIQAGPKAQIKRWQYSDVVIVAKLYEMRPIAMSKKNCTFLSGRRLPMSDAKI